MRPISCAVPICTRICCGNSFWLTEKGEILVLRWHTSLGLAVELPNLVRLCISREIQPATLRVASSLIRWHRSARSTLVSVYAKVKVQNRGIQLDRANESVFCLLSGPLQAQTV
jgi:hypothetical protein